MPIHQPAKIVRYATVVLASAASLSLTAVSGSYIVHQMAQAPTAQPLSSGDKPTTAPTRVQHAAQPGATVIAVGRSTPITPASPSPFVTVGATTDVLATTSIALQENPVSDVGATDGVDGQLQLGSTYVGAELAPVRPNVVAFTVDTNVLATVSNFVLPEQVQDGTGASVGEFGTTQVRTAFNAEHGEVTVTVSDPILGKHGVRLNGDQDERATDAPAEVADPDVITA